MSGIYTFPGKRTEVTEGVWSMHLPAQTAREAEGLWEVPEEIHQRREVSKTII